MPDGRHLVSQDRLAELRRMAEDGAAEDAPFEFTCREMVQILDHVETLQDALLAEAGDFCEVCGCTQNTACEGGCWWVAEGPCSSCLDEATAARRPSREAAENAVEEFLSDELGTEDVPAFTLSEDGDATSAEGKCGWAFYILEADTTSYVHEDLSIEWYGTSWTAASDKEEG